MQIENRASIRIIYAIHDYRHCYVHALNLPNDIYKRVTLARLLNHYYLINRHNNLFGDYTVNRRYRGSIV